MNQAQIFLLSPQQAGAPVSVLLDTVTPNFAGYEYRIDGGEWTTWGERAGSVGPEGVRAWPARPTGRCISFRWGLHAGRNTLEARPFNAAGIRGIVSRVVLDAE